MSQYVLCSKSLASTCLHIYFLVSHVSIWEVTGRAPRYTLQGIPLGLGQVLPLILKDRGATFTELGVFSLQLAVMGGFLLIPKSWTV